jgi:hypothetical protein
MAWSVNGQTSCELREIRNRPHLSHAECAAALGGMRAEGHHRPLSSTEHNCLPRDRDRILVSRCTSWPTNSTCMCADVASGGARWAPRGDLRLEILLREADCHGDARSGCGFMTTWYRWTYGRVRRRLTGPCGMTPPQTTLPRSWAAPPARLQPAAVGRSSGGCQQSRDLPVGKRQADTVGSVLGCGSNCCSATREQSIQAHRGGQCPDPKAETKVLSVWSRR